MLFCWGYFFQGIDRLKFGLDFGVRGNLSGWFVHFATEEKARTQYFSRSDPRSKMTTWGNLRGEYLSEKIRQDLNDDTHEQGFAILGFTKHRRGIVVKDFFLLRTKVMNKQGLQIVCWLKSFECRRESLIKITRKYLGFKISTTRNKI